MIRRGARAGCAATKALPRARLWPITLDIEYVAEDGTANQCK